jgi:hypothetical protein
VNPRSGVVARAAHDPRAPAAILDETPDCLRPAWLGVAVASIYPARPRKSDDSLRIYSGPLSTGYSQANRRSFSPHAGAGIVSVAMTIRTILILAIAIMIGPSWAHASPTCMTASEARAKFPKAHLYWYGSERCWNVGAGYGLRALAAVPVPLPRPAPTAAPMSSPRPASTAEESECRYSPCE